MINSNAYTPRFIHLHDCGTIAYIRDLHVVYYAIAVKSPKDEYVKSVGRQLSAKRLEEAMKYLPIDEGYESADFVLRDSLKAGFIRFSLCAKELELSSVLSDQLVGKMSFMDVKHSAISNVLVRVLGTNGGVDE